MGTSKKILRSQWGVISFLWILLLALPIVFTSNPSNSNQIETIWRQYGIIFILFIINRFALMPMLFFKGKRMVYFISLALLFAISTTAIYRSSPYKDRIETVNERSETRYPRRPSSVRQQTQPVIPQFAYMTLLSILLIGFDFGLAISIRWLLSEHREVEREREMSEVKLAMLSNQVSPHFFMNTLNNIHAFVDINPEKAKQTIIDLSRLMGYLLYETNSKRVPLENDAEFIRDYINLMRLRFEDKVEIVYRTEGNFSGHNIPPLLFLNFIENAFKHGISYKESSFIDILLKCDDSSVTLKVENSAHTRPNHPSQKRSGFGIENSRVRLNLLYADNYTLDIDEAGDKFKVNLNIPL